MILCLEGETPSVERERAGWGWGGWNIFLVQHIHIPFLELPWDGVFFYFFGLKLFNDSFFVLFFRMILFVLLLSLTIFSVFFLFRLMFSFPVVAVSLGVFFLL